MATMRSGKQSVLIVVDVQVGVLAEAWNAERIVSNIEHAILKAREENIPVIWVQHEDAELPVDSAVWQFVPQLQPLKQEVVIHKQFNSAFETTPLDATLAQLNATHIFLAGAATNWCIRATAYAALERGYDFTLIEDAHTTSDLQLDNGTTIDAATIVTDLNIVMHWINYPGRTSSTTRAEEITFEADINHST